MRAITLKDFGGTENLIYTQLDTPKPANDEVLVQVKAISVNPVDAKTRAGKGAAKGLQGQSPMILGWDIAGIVTESGSNHFKPGDEVFGMVNFPGHGKAYAEYVAAPAAHLALKPKNIPFDEAAAATLAALTAWQNITEHAHIKEGSRVLIHAASGGVGHYAVQIARHLGAYVIGTSSAANRNFVLSLGAKEHVDYNAQRFEDVVEDIDYVLDTIGGEVTERSLSVIKKGGVITSIVGGANEDIMQKASAKDIKAVNTMVHSSGANMKELAEWLEKDYIRSYISQEFDFAEMAKAHGQLESGRTVGKIVVTI